MDETDETLGAAVADVVRAFLAEDVLTSAEAASLSDTEDLLERGVLNSLTLTHLVVFLEERYGFRVEPVDFELENFRTLRTMSELVDRKRRES
jgi:acyl carrier protein